MPISENPVEYLIYRLQGRWEISDENVKKIGQALYATNALEYPGPNSDLLALQASELADDQLHLLLAEMPSDVILALDDIPV